MKQDEYSACMGAAEGVARMLLLLPLGDMLEAINRAETLGPILDPTLYLRGARGLEQQKQVIRALYTAQCEIKEAAIEAARKGGGLSPTAG